MKHINSGIYQEESMHDTAKDAEKIGAKMGEVMPFAWLDTGTDALTKDAGTARHWSAAGRPMIALYTAPPAPAISCEAAEYLLNLCRTHPETGNKALIADMRAVFEPAPDGDVNYHLAVLNELSATLIGRSVERHKALEWAIAMLAAAPVRPHV